MIESLHYCMLIAQNEKQSSAFYVIVKSRNLLLWYCKAAEDAFLAQDVIYTSRAYATMSMSICLSVCL